METKPKNKGGRPVGAASKMAKEAREKAMLTGRLPHEIMLDIARGEPQEERHIDARGNVQVVLVAVPLEMRLDAAKAAAPYFAPKISTVEVIQGIADDDLDQLIASLAAEAGVSLGTDGEGEEAEEGTGEGSGTDGVPQRTDGGTATVRRRPVTGT